MEESMMDFATYQRLTFERRQRVLWISIDAGPMNAVDFELHEELAKVFYEAQNDQGSDLIVLTGAGRAFCAGGDMDWFQEMIDDPAKFRGITTDAKRIVNGLLEMEKPIVCRLNGAAAGLGASIALLCDVIIADERALIGDPHVKVGLVAGDGGAVIWPQLIGFARAKEMLLTGDMLRASEAVTMGLINYAVPTDQLDGKVDELVGKILANPRWAVRWTKTAVNLVLRDIANKVMEPAIAYEIASNATADRQEAVNAFVEKRAPNYTGE
jgi:enoyl-CoA hydratase